MTKKIEKHFGIFFITAILIGLFLPSIGIIFEPYILHFLLFILFLSCLKIDFADIITHIKRPLLLTYITFMLLIAIPTLLFFITKLINPNLAIPVLILASMPAGMATATLTDITKGKVSLALVITTTTSLLCPFTIPLLMRYLIGATLPVSTYEMLTMLATIIFIPFAAAFITRKIARKQIQKTKQYYSSISILSIMPLIMGPIAKHSSYFLNNLEKVSYIIVYLFIISATLHIIGWIMVFWLKKKEKIATSITSTYMNSSLAIVFAAKFFGPSVILGVILYQLPWNTMLIPFRHIIKKLK